MFRGILIAGLIAVLIFGAASLSFARCGGCGSAAELGCGSKAKATDAATYATPREAVEVGNKICPVMNNPIDEKKKVTYEYEGKVYSFCCAGCVEEFKKDPGKYIQKIEEELKQQEGSE
jgi:YHS domain-containing protein